MLKSCWDCIAGDRTPIEEVYGTHSNGIPLQVQAPPWPQAQFETENMFLLPKQLNDFDVIELTGNFVRDPKIFKLALLTGSTVPDYQNIACQVELSFPANNGNDKILLKSVVNSIDQNIKDSGRTSDFVVENDFAIKLRVRESSIEFHIEASYIDSVILNHNKDDIRFLSVSGDYEKIKKLDFQFA